jgi:hypothetical protein
MPKILVETISMHKMQYLIDCDNEEHAMDTVVCQEDGLEAFHQEHIGENIFSTWVLSDEEADSVIAESDNAHMGRKMIYTVNYDG